MSVLKGIIKRESPIPLYYQLKEIILGEITSNKLVAEECLPTENEFMATYQISRATVRQAMGELVNENYLYRQKGKGTFVSKSKRAEQTINRVETYREQMKKAGIDPTTQVVCCEVITPNAEICKALNITKDEQVIHLVRVRSVDEEPIVVAKTYMPYQVCSFVLGHNMGKESLYGILSTQEQTCISKAKRTIEAVLASEYEANLLNIKKGKALQVIKTTASNNEDIIIEYTIAKYRGDRNLFIVETQVEL